MEHPDWLPKGWTVDIRIGGFGGKVKYYTHPTNGLKFFSKPQVLRYLNGEVHTPQKKSKMKHRKVKQEKVRIESTVPTELPPPGQNEDIRTKTNDGKTHTDSVKEDGKFTSGETVVAGLEPHLPEEDDHSMANQTANALPMLRLEGETNQTKNISANESIISVSKLVDKPETKKSEETAGDQKCMSKKRKTTTGSLPRRQSKRCAVDNPPNQSGTSNNKAPTEDKAKHLTGLTLAVGDLSWIKEPKCTAEQSDLSVDDYSLGDHQYSGRDDLPMEYLNKIGDFPPSVSLKDILDYPCMRFAVKTLLSEGPIEHVPRVQAPSVTVACKSQGCGCRK